MFSGNEWLNYILALRDSFIRPITSWHFNLSVHCVFCEITQGVTCITTPWGFLLKRGSRTNLVNSLYLTLSSLTWLYARLILFTSVDIPDGTACTLKHCTDRTAAPWSHTHFLGHPLLQTPKCGFSRKLIRTDKVSHIMILKHWIAWWDFKPKDKLPLEFSMSSCRASWSRKSREVSGGPELK